MLTKLSRNGLEEALGRLAGGESLPRQTYAEWLTTPDDDWQERLFEAARRVTEERFGRGVFVRGLIEISSHCRNDCRYCGLRRSNRNAERYRLTADEILDCCTRGYAQGFRTFVLQGGEDAVQTDEWLAGVVSRIKVAFPDAAVTLSVGERSDEAYLRFRQAGADRYLLRHETRNDTHYAFLHPEPLSAANRRRCLFTLRRLGFQTGAGMMVGSPGQTLEHLLDDIAFLEEFRPQMIGIGPFIPAPDTPFADWPAGSVPLTLRLLALLRLRFPDALLPATTALATLDPQGREKAIRAGANVVMPNLSPAGVRAKYAIYANKACTGAEAAEALRALEERLHGVGRCIDWGRGDYKGTNQKEEPCIM